MKSIFKKPMHLALYFIIALMLAFFAKDTLSSKLSFLLSSYESQFSPPVLSPCAIEVAFSPGGGATKAIINAILEARKSVLVSAYSFTSDKIAKALLDAKERHVKVMVILDKSQMTQRYSSASFFINQGFDIRIDIKHAIYHNKVMIIDDKTIITGSFNFTKAAETKNAENVIIVRNNPALAKLYANNWHSHWLGALKPEQFSKKSQQISKRIQQ